MCPNRSSAPCNGKRAASVCMFSGHGCVRAVVEENMQIVNGYVCRDCADVAKAKRGVDPTHAERAQAPKRAESGTAGPLAANGDVGTRLHVIA